MKVLSLFTGAGGFDLGLEAAGYQIAGCVELDSDSRATVQLNRPTWPCVSPGNIHEHRPNDLPNDLLELLQLDIGGVTILAAGPPCQPFSKSGFWATGTTRRLEDPRADTLQAVMHVAEASRPDVILIENVAGISYNGRDEAIRLIETEIERINSLHHTYYRLQILTIDAASYGVPQKRERTFLFAHRYGEHLNLPAATHIDEPQGRGEDRKRLATAWDAIGHLDAAAPNEALKLRGKWADLLPSIPEGQNYLWHTERGGGEPLFGWRTRYWTFLLKLAKARPSWTVQAAPGPSTGPFHWRNRLLSIEELCRLQTFPDGITICGSYSSARRQLGNAVPSAIGELLSHAVRELLLSDPMPDHLSLVPVLRDDCPPPEEAIRVPHNYLALRGQHEAHPGPGLGPRGRSSVLPGRELTANGD